MSCARERDAELRVDARKTLLDSLGEVLAALAANVQPSGVVLALLDDERVSAPDRHG
jgi:hypothetical protein